MDDLKIGEKIKEFRQMKGIGLREMAARANVSASMLSQIENDTANPSINTLKNIAVALNTPLYKFFQDNQNREELVVRKEKRRTIGRMGEEVQYELLTPDVSGQIEFCRMSIPFGKTSAAMPTGHEGEEVAYVVSGSIEIIMEDNVFELSEGDSVKIPPLTLHRWINRSSDEATIIFAITPPCF